MIEESYAKIELDDNIYEVKFINGNLYLPQIFFGTFGSRSVRYLQINSSVLKQIKNYNKVKRTSKRVH